MPSFKSLLTRADESVLEALIGSDVVRVLHQLDSSLATPSALRRLLEQSVRPEEILRVKSLRGLMFDLLTLSEAQELQGVLGLKGSDPFQALKGYNFRKASAREEILFGRLDVVPLNDTSSQDATSPESRSYVSPEYPLFDHQRKAIREAWNSLQDSTSHRVLLHMPTGAGKTRSAMHVVSRFLIRHEGVLVVWLANTEELCEQAAEEFTDAWKTMGNRPVELVRFWSRHDPDLGHIADGFVVAGLAKLHALAQRDIALMLKVVDQTQFVVFDEAHQVVAPTYRFLLDLFLERNPDTWLLGLSATPGRTWNDVNKDAELAAFFDRQKVSLSVEGFDNPIDFLIELGYLARPHFEDLLFEGGAEPTEADLKAIEDGLDVPKHLLDRLAKDEQRNLLVVAAVEKLAETHQRILIFAPNVRSAEVLAAVLRARGWWAHAVTGASPEGTRSHVLDEYRAESADVRIVVNYGVLTTGFDAPRTSAAIIARPTTSLVLYSQMVGRALRGPSVGGNANAEIVTIVDTNLPGFRTPGEMFENWEDVW